MKRVLKVTGKTFVVLAVLGAITLLAWVGWQVMPVNPHHDEWIWNFPPFPLAIAVWFVGIAPLILLAFAGYLVINLCAGLITRTRKKTSSGD